MAVGYYRVNDDSAESFKEINGQSWFATGDIGIIEPDGSLRIIGACTVLVVRFVGACSAVLVFLFVVVLEYFWHCV